MRELQLAAGLRDEGSIPGAVEHTQIALELDPNNAEAELFLGFLHFERGELEDADRHISRGLELLVETGREGAILAEGRNMRGVVLIALHKYDEAVSLLRLSATDALNRAPHLAYGNLGLAYLEAGQYDDALGALRRSIQLQPRFCVGYYRVGQVYFHQRQYREAEEALVQAIEADPACSEAPSLQGAWRLRGEVRARLGLREEALADFERCVVLGASSPDGRLCQAVLDGGS